MVIYTCSKLISFEYIHIVQPSLNFPIKCSSFNNYTQTQQPSQVLCIKKF